jgi:hypothetical protein
VRGSKERDVYPKLCAFRVAPRLQGSLMLHDRGPSRSPTVHRPAFRGASRWFFPRSACPNNSAWARKDGDGADELGLH